MRSCHSHCSHSLRPIFSGVLRHLPGERIVRHGHRRGFIALVLSGSYTEAGDTGRHRVSEGDVIVHQRWESHLDHVEKGGAKVLVLPLDHAWKGPFRVRSIDPDMIVRLAAHDVEMATAVLATDFQNVEISPLDWPDQLATDLRDDPDINLNRWAFRAGLHSGSLARGFRQIFGINPCTYRTVQRTLRSLALLENGSESLTMVAADCGFSDQAHMTRAIKAITGYSPSQIRKIALR